MNNKSFKKHLYSIIALVVSGVIGVALIFLIYKKSETTVDFDSVLKSLTTIFIAVSGLLSAILMIFLATSSMALKSSKAKIITKISKTTQKMHNFRSIAEIMLNSNIWLPGLKDYIEKEFVELSYFEVKEFYKGKSKMAIEFLQQTHNYGETENIYLELKSLLMTDPKEKIIPEIINYPISYNNNIIEKWTEHKCGSGLWYVFGYRYGNYKQSLNLEAVFERHQEKILTLANTIDNDVFEDSSFNEVFFSKLWEYMTKEVIPKLYQYQSQIDRNTPRLLRYLYTMFLLLIVFGVVLPLIYLILDFSSWALIVGYSVIISTIFYMAITFHVFLSKEVYP